MSDIELLALKDRVCDATDRIPTSRWPFFSTTLKATIPAGQTVALLTFEAERDTLLTDLSISALTDADVVLAGDVDCEYCNVDYAEHTDIDEFAYCCSRKPIFLMGVKENKRLRFQVTLAAVAPAGGAFVEATISGFQGDGCCS